MSHRRELVRLQKVCEVTGRHPGTIINWAEDGCPPLGKAIYSVPDPDHKGCTLYDLKEAKKGCDAYYPAQDKLEIDGVPCTFINAAAKERGGHVSMLRNYFVLRRTSKKTRGLPKFVKREHVWNDKTRSGKERTYITDVGLGQFDKDRREATPPEAPGTWLTYAEQVEPFGFGRNYLQRYRQPERGKERPKSRKGQRRKPRQRKHPLLKKDKDAAHKGKGYIRAKREYRLHAVKGTTIKKRRKEWVYHREDLQTLYDLIRPHDSSLWLTAEEAKNDPLLRIPLGLLWQWTVRKCPLIGRKLTPEEFAAGPDPGGGRSGCSNTEGAIWRKSGVRWISALQRASGKTKRAGNT